MAKGTKRADGRLQKSFTYNGKKYFVYAKSKADLEDKYLEKMAALKQGKEKHDNPTLDQFHERWTESRSGSIKPATLRCQHFQYESCANVIVNGKRLGDHKLAEIKGDDISQVQKALQASGKNTTQTINDKIAVLSHVFHDAIRGGYVDYNPCLYVRPLKRTEKRARDTIHRALTIAEQKAFFDAAAGSNYYDVFRMAVLTGMRIGEIGALYNSDIFDNAIHIERTITKTETGGYEIGTDPKTMHGRRTIPLNPAIIEVISHQRKINAMLDAGKPIPLHDTIFKAPERGLLMATPADREIARICKRAGIEKFTAHALRATFTTRCIEQGMAPRTLQELLGHADFSITMNLYGHVTNDTLEDAMKSVHIAI